MKRKAICLKCGDWKPAPYTRCSNCGFQPKPGSHDEIKSVYLSVGRFENLEEQERYLVELERTSESLQKGESPKFDLQELERLEEQRRLAASVSPRQAWFAVFRLFLPAITILAGLGLLIIVLKWFTK
jgi:hypothetical protein